MAKLTEAQAIELFHLAFLGVLSKEVDPKCYVLKGGANLRYFFDSIRYSEDVDLDVKRLEDWQLTPKVDRALRSIPLISTLRTAGVELSEFTKPKQTETTQRWKIKLAVDGHKHPVRTKIEFSHREGDDRFIFEFVPSRVTDPYALRPPSAQHYEISAALEQKIGALTGRNQTQARDVFDLELLLRRGGFDPPSLDDSVIEEAINRTLELSYDEFRDQVGRFLEPDFIALYESEAAWEQIQTYVAGKLEEFR
ncbi:MAG: nucleotidyl transferase AbiEii/AbiGii toxin family protein [Thermoleophilia bacterium]|nr:nucleotidyl transferase AbiEii/AbiGii toxin family protein [Thermoleophilia bacterium]